MVLGGAAKLLAQMRRGAIEFCVLALLRDGDRYGLDLARTLAADGLVTSEGTIYPLLARLRQDGMVETSWHESPQGPPRRYYRLTEDGRAALDAFAVQWRQFRDAVDVVLEGDQSAGASPAPDPAPKRSCTTISRVLSGRWRRCPKTAGNRSSTTCATM
jgi:PadR family transcriptional regulator, regulatory protein PadR